MTAIQANPFYRDGKLAFSERDYSRALEKFRQAMKSDPQNGNPLFYIGYIQEYSDQKEDAIASYISAVGLKMDPDLKEKAFWKIVLYYKYQQNWSALYTYSSKFLNFKDIPDVRRLMETADERRDPVFARIVSSAREAQKLEEEGKEEEAYQIYQTLVSLRDDYEQGHWKIAVYLMKTNEYSGALNHLKKLIQLNPESWQYYYKMAICEYKLSDFTASQEHLAKSRNLNEAPGEAFNYYVKLTEGLNFLELGDHESALKKLKGLLKEKINTSYGAIARAEAASGNIERARELYTIALDIEPEQRDALIARYIVAVHSGSRLDTEELKNLFDMLNVSLPSGISLDLAKAMAEQARISFQNQQYENTIDTLQLIPAAIITQVFSRQTSPTKKPEPKSTKTADLSALLIDYMPPKGSSDEYHFLLARSNMGLEDFSEAIDELQRSNPSYQRDYLMGKIEALREHTTQARFYLERASESNPLCTEAARNDSAFQSLASDDTDFSVFLFGEPQQSEAPKMNSSETQPTPANDPQDNSRISEEYNSQG